MPCFHPLSGFYSKEVGKSGKRGITFDRGASFSGVRIPIPCGRCVGCRLEHSRQWAMRCLHEKRLHKDNCFVTLTYAPDKLPPYGTLVKRDLQLFMKRLRNARGSGVRFYACGEYGDVNRRPHYHAILFGVAFTDMVHQSTTKGGHKLYTSAELSRYWVDGFHTIGDVNFDTAAYVARYVMKKVTGPLAANHYDVVDGDGVVFRRLPEFTNMSRRPGIGSGWYKRYGAETYAHDNVVVNGKKVRPPRFYDGMLELTDPTRLLELKKERKLRAALHRADNMVDRRRVRERVTELTLKQLKREV